MKSKSLKIVLVIAALVISIIAGYHALTSEHAPPVPIKVTETVLPELNNPDIKDTADEWLELIGNAQYTIDIEAFYFNPPQEPLSDVYNALAVGLKIVAWR